MKRLGILLSGRGSNFEAIADSVAAGRIQAEIAVVISNRAEARGLQIARERGLNGVCIPSKGLDREVYDRMVVAELRQNQVDLVCLAGFMRLLSAYFVREFPLAILNIHPGLLPAFPGLDAQHQALEHGVKVSGCTVHFVDEYLDHGPIIVQRAVPVLEDDTVDTLSARILVEEHRIYTEAINIVLSGNWRLEGRRVEPAERAPSQNEASVFGMRDELRNCDGEAPKHGFDLARGAVADVEPDHLGRAAPERAEFAEVGVLRQDRETFFAGEIPDVAVGGFSQAAIVDVHASRKEVRESPNQPWGKVVVDEQPHSTRISGFLSRSAAKARQARMSCSVRYGKSARICWWVMPAARYPRTS
jgi:phosphoribosylglycinamide formyltransferase-1